MILVRVLASHKIDFASWDNSPTLEDEVFTTTRGYDALKRVVSSTTPDRSTIHLHYNTPSSRLINVALRGTERATRFVTVEGRTF